jgi:hypothetical protein
MKQVGSILILVTIVLVVASRARTLSTSPLSPSPSSTPSLAPTILPTETPTPSPTVTRIPTPKPTSVSMSNNSSWQYPGSVTIDKNHWQSNANADAITNWYTQKLEAMGFKAKSFVRTETNGRILNKLVAANSEQKISVEISQKSPDAVVIITLDN